MPHMIEPFAILWLAMDADHHGIEADDDLERR
jgi:hypothetical protein